MTPLRKDRHSCRNPVFPQLGIYRLTSCLSRVGSDEREQIGILDFVKYRENRFLGDPAEINNGISDLF